MFGTNVVFLAPYQMLYACPSDSIQGHGIGVFPLLLIAPNSFVRHKEGAQGEEEDWKVLQKDERSCEIFSKL